MEEFREYFLCAECNNKKFKRIYTFSFLFHGVNFSDELIYDEITDELYQCTKCSSTYSMEQIKSSMAEIKKKRKIAVL